MLGPVKRNTTPSRSILQTTASTARGRTCGGATECRRPFAPSLKGRTAAPSGPRISPRGNFTQPPRSSAWERMAGYVAGIVPVRPPAFSEIYPLCTLCAEYVTAQGGNIASPSVALHARESTESRRPWCGLKPGGQPATIPATDD